MFENFNKRSFPEAVLDIIAKWMYLALRDDRHPRGDSVKRARTIADIRLLPAVRSKHRKERRDLAVLWGCAILVVAFLWVSLGTWLSVLASALGLAMAALLGRIMFVTHRTEIESYDQEVIATMMMHQKSLRSYLEKEVDEEGLIKKRADAPLLWDAAYVLSEKSGLPFPRMCVVNDERTTAMIAPRNGGAEIVIGSKTLSFIKKKKYRAYVLFGHEYGHWLENDWARGANYLGSVALLGGLSSIAVAMFLGTGALSFFVEGIELRLCLEGIGIGIIGMLLSLAYGTIGYVARRLDSEVAADAIAAYLVGSKQKVASFFLEGASEWVNDARTSYDPFSRIVHPPMKVRARTILEDALDA